ncbi:MAG: hypothetical protein ACLPYZ_18330 [Limisphaerales bacterium]
MTGLYDGRVILGLQQVLLDYNLPETLWNLTCPVRNSGNARNGAGTNSLQESSATMQTWEKV